MANDKTWRWAFRGFRSRLEGHPVQAWFDSLPQDDKENIMDLLSNLMYYTSRKWPKWAFDSLKGERGISEIKVPEIRCFRNGKYVAVTYRIYGYFGPGEHCYAFLHGTDKDEKNDRVGKQIAKDRFNAIQTGIADTHEFVFEEEPYSKAEEKPGRPS
jgi:hypothetical protein